MPDTPHADTAQPVHSTEPDSALSPLPAPPGRRRDLRAWFRPALLGLIAIGSMGLLIWLLTQGWLDEGRLTTLLEPFGPWTALLFVAFYSLATMIWAPGALLALVAVSLFDPLTAVLLSLVGFLTGGSGSYILSRVLGRDALKRIVEREASRVRHMTGNFQRNALLHVVVLRVLGLPNNVASYLSGAAGIPWRTYIAGTLLGASPNIIAITLIGGSFLQVFRARSLDVLWAPESLWTLGAFLLAAAVLLVVRSRHRKLAMAGDAE